MSEAPSKQRRFCRSAWRQQGVAVGASEGAGLFFRPAHCFTRSSRSSGLFVALDPGGAPLEGHVKRRDTTRIVRPKPSGISGG
jgi:hypothetical protein